MDQKNEILPAQLYLITPSEFNLDAYAGLLARTLDAADDTGRVACVQLRQKNADMNEITRSAEFLAPIVQERGVAFIVNDHPDIAAKTGCDGVHIGQEDGSYKAAREIVGEDAIIGVTCHDSRHLAIEAAEQGADYVAFGTFYPTQTKNAKGSASPEILQTWSLSTIVPCVAIGGITTENCGPLVQAGADFLAVVSAVWDHPEGPEAAVRQFNEAIQRATEK